MLSCSLIFSPFHLALMFLFTPAFVIRVLPCVLRSVCTFHWRSIYHSYPSFSPPSRQCTTFEYQGFGWQCRDTWDHKKSPASFKGQGGEQGSDSGKEHLPQPNKATVRGGSPLTRKNTHIYTQRALGEYTPGDGSMRMQRGVTSENIQDSIIHYDQ